MEMAEAFIFDAGWVFFAAWGILLAAVSVIAFGREVLGITYVETDDENQSFGH